MKKLVIFFILTTTGFFSCSSYADADMINAVLDKAIEGGFSELEKQIIEKHFKKTSNETSSTDNKKTKKNKKKKPPPGLAKQLERNGILPPGLAKRDLPSDLSTELPKPVEGMERAIVDNAVVLIEKATGRIIDIMKDVITGN